MFSRMVASAEPECRARIVDHGRAARSVALEAPLQPQPPRPTWRNARGEHVRLQPRASNLYPCRGRSNRPLAWCQRHSMDRAKVEKAPIAGQWEPEIKHQRRRQVSLVHIRRHRQVKYWQRCGLAQTTKVEAGRGRQDHAPLFGPRAFSLPCVACAVQMAPKKRLLLATLAHRRPSAGLLPRLSTRRTARNKRASQSL